MAKTLEQIQAELDALKTQFSDFSALSPVSYYTHQYSGEEIDDAVTAAQNTIRTDLSQSLTTAQREQGQRNLGVTWPCNPNLLDNWYFGNPVNQRGKTEYSPTWNGYSIDRWSVEANSELSIKIVDGGITIKNNASTQRQLKQILDTDTTLEGNLCTLSVLVSGISGSAAICYSQTQDPYKNSIDFVYLSAGLCSGRGTKIDAQHKIVIVLAPGTEVTIKAIKLELGPTQTLAHQDADGKWVLNEIPDYGEELRRCQRYFVNLNPNKVSYFAMPPAIASNTTVAYSAAMLPVPMRTQPTISHSERIYLSSGTGDFPVSSLGCSPDTFTGSYIQLAYVSSSLTANSLYRVQGSGDPTSTIQLSADL